LPGYRLFAANWMLGRGDTAGAQALLDDCLAGSSEERCWRSEILRLQAELLRIQGDRTRAEELLREAMRVSREQHARLWEDRAARSLETLLAS
jgi:outer membrane PBP1 activator LpoA protein